MAVSVKHIKTAATVIVVAVGRIMMSAILFLAFTPGLSPAADLRLDALIALAMRQSPEIQAAAAQIEAAEHKIPQAESLQDPMVMFGYQNAGFSRITYRDMSDSQIMYSVSQMFPFPGKRALKREMAEKEAVNLGNTAVGVRLTLVRTITELYYDLFLAYKTLDLIGDRARLYERLEAAAKARYSSGMGGLQDVVMAQSEKYMLIEAETMQRQKITATEAMLRNALGSAENGALGVPVQPEDKDFPMSLEEATAFALIHSPVIIGKKQMVSVAETKVAMAEKEYYPDFTITGTIGQKDAPDAQDMWSITTSLNIPLYYQSKQREGVGEAKAQRIAAEAELRAAKLMLTSAIRDSYAMLESSGTLMDLYKTGLIPKTHQDYEAALTGYINGKGEAQSVINRLKNFINYEQAYWEKFSDKGKAIARIESYLGRDVAASAAPRQEDGR